MASVEERVRDNLVPDPAKDTGVVGAARDMDRQVALQTMLLIATVIAGVAGVTYTVVYFLRRDWRILAGVMGIGVAVILLFVARRFARRGRLQIAGYWALGAVLAAFVPGELFWANQTAYFALAVILLLALVAYVVRPRHPWIWGAAVAFYLACVFVINWQEDLLSFDRYAAAQDPMLRFAPPSIVVVLVVASGVQAFLAYRRIRTIRVRLLVSFVSVGLLPVILVALAGTFLAWRSGQRDATERLDLAATFMRSELDAWVDSMEEGLDTVLTEGEAISYARLVLRPRTTDSDTDDLYSDLRVALTVLFRDQIEQSELFDELFLIGTDGVTILSSDEGAAGQPYGNQSFFQSGLIGLSVQPLLSATPGEPATVVAAVPVLDEQHNVLGVLAGRASAVALEEIIGKRIGVAESGEVYLVGPGGIALTELRIGLSSVGVSSVGARSALLGQAGVASYENYHGLPVVGAYRWLPRLGVALLVEQPQSVTFATVFAMLIANGSIALFVAAVSVVIALRITQAISRPLADLADTADRIAGGELGLVTGVGRIEETGTLARAFNSMTAQLRDLVGELEQRVEERTSDLERRSFYLEAAAQVGRTASSILDPDRLFRVIVGLIRDQFDLYYVGLFQVDPGGRWAELRAGTGEAGRRMLARGHRIQVGEGMVGWTIEHAEARIAAEAGEDEIRVLQEELPDTRSEAALPLRSRGRVLGALTVQSDQLDAFDQDLLVVLQTMADQVAVALDNARLFDESQAALVAARRASGDMSRAAWGEVLRARADLGFRGDEGGVERAYAVWRPEMERAAESGVPSASDSSVGDDAGRSLAVPIQIQEEVIGVLDLRKPVEAGEWTSAQVALAEQIASQLSQALENARLYQETQRRGVREQQLREIGTRMQSTVDLDAILRMAIEDLARALDVPSAFVQLYEGRHSTED